MGSKVNPEDSKRYKNEPVIPARAADQEPDKFGQSAAGIVRIREAPTQGQGGELDHQEGSEPTGPERPEFGDESDGCERVHVAYVSTSRRPPNVGKGG